jgi:uncharacterized Zn finger protein
MENFEEHYKQRKAQEEERAAKLVAALTKAGRQEELFRASESVAYRNRLYKEFGL